MNGEFIFRAGSEAGVRRRLRWQLVLWVSDLLWTVWATEVRRDQSLDKNLTKTSNKIKK